MRLVAALLLICASSARADGNPADTFAILSLLGDRMTVVSHTEQTGTHFGSERHNIVKLLVEGTHAARLVLLTKVRYDAEVIIRTGNIAFGKLDGLGFYVDTNRPMANVKTGDTYRWFVAPYAYFRVSIVDLGTGRAVSEQNVHASTTLASHAGVGTWEEITPQEKMNGLQALLSQNVTRSVVLALRAAK
jgi:hypothetical protein